MESNMQVVITGAMALFAAIGTMIGYRKHLSVDNFESFLEMRLARLGVLIVSPLLYPYIIGRRMVRRISRSLDKSKIRFAEKQMKRLDLNIPEKNSIYNKMMHNKDKAQKQLNRTASEFYSNTFRDLSYETSNFSYETMILIRMGTWLLGAIPIAFVMCVTWIPELRSVDIGTTESLSAYLQTIGQWLISVSN